jgi:quercetin 2,3-dioxygenase
MSGPLRSEDVPLVEASDDGPSPLVVEVTDSHEATVGRFTVRRALPRRTRRTVGAWCFADHLGPASVTEDEGLDIGPHPHIGLQTVTWLISGGVLHRDSLGSEQPIRPGQLNLMTAGRGVAHSEERTGRYRGEICGIQLWLAQPERTRHGDPAFEHHGELPRLELEHGTATVLVGELHDTASPARRDTDHVGVDLDLRSGRSSVATVAHHEYALVVLNGAVAVGDRVITPGHLAYLGTGHDDLVLRAEEPSRMVLLGGEPFEARLAMWWNYVGRSRDEIDLAHRQWQDGSDRFGPVDSRLERIVGP